MGRTLRRATKMIACPGCGFEAPDDSAFCSECGTKLAASAAVCDERKVVTTLFCDLVAFTAMGEAADPEDVDAVLRSYYAAARKVIESHGGTVEKFIGDAVVGVFGVPAIHEDDPERGVRAALRIIEALEGMTRPDGSPLEARAGVNTGEALVRLEVDPGSGAGFLAGDAVNVAARLQGAAPPMGVVVGEATHALTAGVMDYEDVEPVKAKGKSEPVHAWRARAPRPRTGGTTPDQRLTPLVGRLPELASLETLFDECIESRMPRLALILGEPGIGKSRLVSEFALRLDRRPGLATWRQGRCLPYGEGVTFSALQEIVKAHAGIFDTDDTTTADAKLDSVVTERPDRQWIRQRLGALLGLPAPESSREESFTAWLGFMVGLGAREPTVLVFEDLHWADAALLEFLELLSGGPAAAPLLVVGTARPELLDQHPGFAAGATRAHRIELAPLSAAEVEALAAAVASRLDVAVEVPVRVVERCGGNPFFAEQTIRLLADSGESRLPGSVHAVIAARLDALPPQDKALLADAAVVGDTFWDGALATMDRDLSAADRLDGLVRRQFVRRVPTSSFEGQREFAFSHALMRDVAYGQIPRRAKAGKHVAVVDWMRETAGARLDDFADVIAHHYTTALELARVSGAEALADSLVDPAVRYLTLAGDRGLRLDVPAAERRYASALRLLPSDHAGRAELLVKWADALRQLGDYRRSADALSEAVAALQERGDIRAAAAAMMKWCDALLYLGDPTAPRLGRDALALLEAEGPSVELVYALEVMASYRAANDDSRAGVELAERAIAVAERLGEPAPLVALHFRGVARCDLGDAGGLEDLQRALAFALERGSAADVVMHYFNMGTALWLLEGAAAVLDMRRRGLELADQRGHKSLSLAFSLVLADDLIWAGDWEGALAASLATESRVQEAGDIPDLVWLRSVRSLLLALRGAGGTALELATWAAAQGQASEDLLAVTYATLALAVAADALGDVRKAHSALTDYDRLVGRRVEGDFALRLPLAVRTALRAGDVAVAERLPAHLTASTPLYEHALSSSRALLTETRGEVDEAVAVFAMAASAWREFGVPFEEAQALLGQGRCLVALDRASEAVAPLAAAREIFGRLGAKPALDETDELMQHVASA